MNTKRHPRTVVTELPCLSLLQVFSLGKLAGLLLLRLQFRHQRRALSRAAEARALAELSADVDHRGRVVST